MKKGTRVKHTRRNNDVVTGTIVGKKDHGRGLWLQLRADVGGKKVDLWVRPSQVEVI